MEEKNVINIIYEMDKVLSFEQLNKLKNVLYIELHDEFNDSNNIIKEESLISDEEKIKMFIMSKKISGRQESTLKQYKREIYNCKNFIKKDFINITTFDLKWYFSHLKEDNNISMATLNTRIRYLNSFWNFLLRENFVTSNPIDKIENIKIENIIKKSFSSKELEMLRVSCKNFRDRAIIEFLYTTGIRVSELCSLKICDLDFQKQEFKIMGKGKKERILYISDSTNFYLTRYLHSRNKDLYLIKEEPLFATIKKPYNKLSIAGVQYILKNIGNNANVGNVHPHRFRRTFATNLLNNGMNIEEIMWLMGHSKMDSTLIYCNINQNNIKNNYYKYF